MSTEKNTRNDDHDVERAAFRALALATLLWEQLLDDFRRGRLQSTYRGDNNAPLDDYRIDRSIYQGKKYNPVELAQFGRGCRFACSCSRGKVATMLKMLGEEEIDAIVAEQGSVAVRCEFCNLAYEFDRVDCAELFVEGITGPAPTRPQ